MCQTILRVLQAWSHLLPYEMNTTETTIIVIPILKIGKARHREGKWLAYLGSQTPELTLLPPHQAACVSRSLPTEQRLRELSVT